MSESPRKPRFKRTPSEHIQLTERDIDIIECIYRHRLLRTNHVLKLLKNQFATVKTLRGRLSKLYHHGYLDRVREENDFAPGTNPMIYAVATKGVSLLADGRGVHKPKTDITAANRRLSRLFIEHALLVADVMVAFEAACQGQPVRLITPEEILARSPEETKKQKNPFGWKVNIKHNSGSFNLGVVPDKIFGLHFKERPEGRNRLYFFLEADRSTMPVIRKNLNQTSYFKKLLGYFETYKQGLHTKKYNFKNFRVLTVTTSEDRIQTMLEANCRLNQGQGSRIFLFVHRDQLDQEDILKIDWRSGRDQELVRLAE